MGSIDDHELIHRILNGDKHAFDTLVRKHYQNIYSYCIRRIGIDDAADLTQEIFTKLVKTIFTYKFTGKFSNFLFTITVNTCNDYAKRTHQLFENIDDLQKADEHPTPFEAVIETEQAEIIKRKLNELPDVQKDAIILYYYHDLKAKDIAKITGVSLPTAKSRIKQGMDKLRKSFREEDYFER
ncbi:RNA polymerase sigma factor [uncultured Oscillibacter sp.]|uniref:RNA polymerase sigma factor n=1 Tax=uncultured Oscillibacter sp. TaxID=876091 RepID=UPI0025F0201F|nr:RNA polymerase sigma factor [uncultured Oscillibacter sp.]